MILSIGANYHEHLKEMNTLPPKTPGLLQERGKYIGSGEQIILPPATPTWLIGRANSASLSAGHATA